jgi:hypothetical protein
MNWHKLRVLTLIKRFSRYIKIGFWSASSLSLSLRIIKSSRSKLLGLGDERAPWKRTAQIAPTNSIFLCVRYIITNRFSHSDETQLQFNDIQLIRYIFKNIFKLKKINWITFSCITWIWKRILKVEEEKTGRVITGWWAVDEARQTVSHLHQSCSFYTIWDLQYDCLFQNRIEQNNWTYNTFGLVIQRVNFSKIKIMDGDECYMTY